MRATTTRKLCTLSYYFRSHLHNNLTKNFSSLSYHQIQQHHLDSILNPSPQEDLSDILLGKTHPVKKLGYDEVDLEEKERRIPEVLDSHNFASLGNGKALERKQMFEDTRRVRADRIFKMVARNLGTTATDYVLDCLSPKQGLKEYNESIQSCIKKARETDDENVSAEEMSMTYHLLKSMSENGFQLEEQICRPILEYIIDMGLVQEFQLFYDFIKAWNPSSISRLGYYEMLLWIRVNNEEKIRDICQYIKVEHSKDTYALQESYLLALCQSGCILDVLKNIDMEKLTSAKPISNIFQLLGRLLLESDAENLLLDLTVRDYDADNISNFIASYALSIPNLAVEDMILKIKNLHDVLEVLPSSSTYEKIVLYWCGMHKFVRAYMMVNELQKMNLEPTTAMYNAILAGYFHEKGLSGGLRVIKHMQDANVMPDSQTFRFLVGICETEDDINKYYEELMQSGIRPYYMSLIRDAAACWELEKAKQS